MMCQNSGIGKTALAGRVISRLRERPDRPADAWAVAVHVGAWNPQAFLNAIAQAVQGVVGRWPVDNLDRVAAMLTAADVDDVTKLSVIHQMLERTPLLVVFDDFEQNLTVGGDRFLDTGFGEVFAGLGRAAGRGKLLLTCRYPVPGGDDLLDIPLPPLTRSELGRLLLRLPTLNELTGPDRRVIVDTIGGHPRLLEFADAILKGQRGRGRLRHIAEKLRHLAEQEHIALARSPAAAPSAADAAAQAVALGARDILLTELLDLLSPAQRHLLLQAAVSRIPTPLADLVRAAYGGPPTADQSAALAAGADRLVDLTLLTPVDGQLRVQTWVSDALVPHQGDELATRHDRAAAMRQVRLSEGRAGFDDLTELAHHLTATGGSTSWRRLLTVSRASYPESSPLPRSLAKCSRASPATTSHS